MRESVFVRNPRTARKIKTTRNCKTPALIDSKLTVAGLPHASAAAITVRLAIRYYSLCSYYSLMKFTLNSVEVRRRKGGFTLVEIMIVVVIIGLLAAIAAPMWATARRNAKINTFINDLRIGVHAAQRCVMDKGAWPAETGPGVCPTLLAGFMQDAYWTGPTPLGGNWDWDYGTTVTAGLAVASPTVDAATMLIVDQKIDDGNLSTGDFRQSGSGYIYILEP
jgi:prepilin-type N-terminal cleavage/methylation domain-containing protein